MPVEELPLGTSGRECVDIRLYDLGIYLWSLLHHHNCLLCVLQITLVYTSQLDLEVSFHLADVNLRRRTNDVDLYIGMLWRVLQPPEHPCVLFIKP